MLYLGRELCGQSCKGSMIVNYGSRVILCLKIPHITTLEPQYMIVEPLKYWPLVQWLCEENQVLKVVGSYPSTIYWMDIFTFICCKNCMAHFLNKCFSTYDWILQVTWWVLTNHSALNKRLVVYSTQKCFTTFSPETSQ